MLLRFKAKLSAPVGAVAICFIVVHLKSINTCMSRVDHLVYQGQDLSGILYRFDASNFTISQFEGLRMDGLEMTEDDGHMMPSCTVEYPQQYRASLCSNEATSNSVMSQEPEVIKKKKKKSSGFLPGIVLSLSSRRKGAPQRAHLS